MQVPNALIVVAAEVNIVLIVSAVFFFIHSRKLKSLMRRQQEKLLDLLKSQQKAPVEAKAAPATTAPSHTYKSYLNAELDATSAEFAVHIQDQDIAQELPVDSPFSHRILALRYAFLRAEELGTTETRGTPEYWSIFQQALAPLLTPLQAEDSNEELNTAKKRIENLEKFKRLFFDMEKQWGTAKASAGLLCAVTSTFRRSE
jgi:hypothetical protein